MVVFLVAPTNIALAIALFISNLLVGVYGQIIGLPNSQVCGMEKLN